MKGKVFKEERFKGVKEGRITQFVEIMKHQPRLIFQSEKEFLKEINTRTSELRGVFKARYKVGETVYLKEPYLFGKHGIIYKYCNPESGIEKGWNNKLFMPAKYARYFIEITAVRCERLQDISYGDCFKTGIKSTVTAVPPYEMIYRIPNNPNYYYHEKQAFSVLIDSIHGKGTWERNPFVWVYDFKLKK